MQAALPFFIADGAQSQGQQFLRLQYGINIAGITLRITKGSIQQQYCGWTLLLASLRLLADIHPASRGRRLLPRRPLGEDEHRLCLFQGHSPSPLFLFGQ